jgi:hypothetical protein
MYINETFRKFLKDAKGVVVLFAEGKAYSIDKGLVVWVNLPSHELDGCSITLKDLRDTLKFIDEQLVKQENKIFATKGTKSKSLYWTTHTDDRLFKQENGRALPISFHEKFIRCSKYESTDETRYFLCGVYLGAKGDICATNGKFLMVYKENEEYAIDRDVIIKHHPALNNLKVSAISVYEDSVDFIKEDVHFSVPIIKGQFPNYKRLLVDKDKFVEIPLVPSVIESLKIAENFVEKPYCAITFTNKKIETKGEHPYTDVIDIQMDYVFDFSFDINLVMFNQCVEDVNSGWGNKKSFLFKDYAHPVQFEDQEKIMLCMPIQRSN